MALFTWQKKKDEATGEEKFELPEALVKQIEDGSKAAASLSKIETMLADQASVQAAATAAQKKRDDDAAAAAARKTQQDQQGTIEEQIEALMLEGRTKEAIQLATSGQSQAILTVRADQIKREVFDDGEKFPYYHGDIKREIDSMLEQQPLAFRQNPQNIENCYKTVMGGHLPEILEGKLKNRFGGSSHKAGSGDAGDTGTGKDGKNTVIPDDVKRAAKLLGYKPEEYVKMLDEDGVGYA